MIRLFEFLLHGCWHKWEVQKVVNLVASEKDTIGHGARFYYQCDKCKRVKKKDVK